ALPLNDGALGAVLIGVFLEAFLNHLGPFDDEPAAITLHLQHLAAFAAFGAGDHHHHIPFFNMTSLHNSNHLRRQRDNLHEFLLAQLAGDRPENARAARVVFLVNNHNGVAIEPQVRAVAAPDRLPRAHYDRIHHLAFFDRSVRSGLFDVGLDDITHMGVTLVAPQNPN